jgi:protein-tyrosine phosphatase
VDQPFRITTVCLGNICRSPMAEVVLRDRVASVGLADRIVIDSGGTGDWHLGYPMDSRAAATLAAEGYRLAEHTARQVHRRWLSDVDLALTMDSDNYRDVLALGATADVRMFRSFDPELSALQPPHPELDVPDPYYGGDSGFRDVLDMLERAADGLIDHLRTRFN